MIRKTLAGSSFQTVTVRVFPWGSIRSISALNLEIKLPANPGVIEYNVRLLAKFALE